MNNFTLLHEPKSVKSVKSAKRCRHYIYDKITHKKRLCRMNITKTSDLYCKTHILPKTFDVIDTFDTLDTFDAFNNPVNNKKDIENENINYNETYGICCFCKGYCNSCSQTCGSCARTMSMFGIDHLAYELGKTVDELYDYE